jgi:hypothetical protein
MWHRRFFGNRPTLRRERQTVEKESRGSPSPWSSQFIANNGMTWPEFFDGQGWGNSLARRFDIRSIPQMWLLDREGRIITKDGRNDLDGQVAVLLSTP